MKTRTIKNIGYYIEVNGILYLSSPERKVYDESGNENLESHNYSPMCWVSVNNHLIMPITEGLGNTYIYDTVEKTGFELEGSWIIRKWYNNNNLIPIQENFPGDRKIKKTKIYDLDTYQFVQFPQYVIYNSRGNLYKDNMLYVLNDTCDVLAYSVLSESILWQFSVADLNLHNTDSILGLFGQILVVTCDTDYPGMERTKAKIYLGIDIQDGRIIWRTDQVMFDDRKRYTEFVYLYSFQWENNQTLLKGLCGDYYSELDTQTGQITTWNIRSLLDKENLSNQQSTCIQGKYLYFNADDDIRGGFASVVGAFDTETRTIAWYHKVDTESSIRPAEPNVFGNKVYALDNSNCLHIMELEEGDGVDLV
ncbi:MAG: hypothetical protein ACRCVT_14735 [Leadbetterella sp.]